MSLLIEKDLLGKKCSESILTISIFCQNGVNACCNVIDLIEGLGEAKLTVSLGASHKGLNAMINKYCQ